MFETQLSHIFTENSQIYVNISLFEGYWKVDSYAIIVSSELQIHNYADELYSLEDFILGSESNNFRDSVIFVGMQGISSSELKDYYELKNLEGRLLLRQF